MADPARPWPEEIIDPRKGDVEADASSPKQQSLLALAGSLFAEISLPKLFAAWFLSIVVPGLLLGATPIVATAWVQTFRVDPAALAGLGTLLFLAAMALVGWYGFRPLFRLAEANFWALNALAVQPLYALVRETIRHVSESIWARDADSQRADDQRGRIRATSSAAAGVILALIAAAVIAWAFPHTRWNGVVADLMAPHRLIVPVLANAIVIVMVYLAAAALIWGIADANMPQPKSLRAFDAAPDGKRTWRVAHLSDVHVVGERYGFRIECGRAGPRGNVRFEQLMQKLEEIHAAAPLDLVLITGDMTDAGSTAEWAEFLDTLARHPVLTERTLILPGNHDVNIVDRANPARLDLPLSPGMRLRQLRCVSAMDAVQGDRVRVMEPNGERGDTVRRTLDPWRSRIEAFADRGTIRESLALRKSWQDLFPMILEPETEDGLGVAVLNSNAETHFSMTNALGIVSLEQTLALKAATRRFPKAVWIVAIHHHLVEYPMAVKAFSERIGTALINGSWFVRELLPFGQKLVVMHGHRHVDWIGRIGRLKIVSAPSPVMGGTDEKPTYFLIHTLANEDGTIRLTKPERIDLPGEASAGALPQQRLDIGPAGGGGRSARARGRERAAG
ncbi:MAG: metallophosphoesterase [Hyphomicrobiales bacterium]